MSFQQSRKIKRESSEGYISDKSSSNEAVDQVSSEASERAVLVMRGASNDPHSEAQRESDLDSRNQPHYRFTRQPVKYYRHHNPAARFANPGRVVRQPAALARVSPGSADSSRSSSPEPGTQRLSQTSPVQCERTGLLTNASDGKANIPPSPREVVQYMLGLDSSTSTATTASPSTTKEFPRKVAAERQADRSMTLPNMRQSAGQSHAPSTKTIPVEHNLTPPAQKILSGLKLRRSHSGKDEQLFV